MKSKTILLTAATAFFTLMLPMAALSQLAVFDASTFRQSILTAENSVRTVTNQGRQIAHAIRMIELQMQALERVTDAEYWRIGRNGILGQFRKIDTVFRRADDIERRVNRINREFEEITRQNEKADSTAGGAALTSEEILQKSLAWQADLMAATESSIEAQVTVEEVRMATEAVARYLQESEEADSQLRQIQSTNSMLSVMSTQLGTLSMATAGAARQVASQSAIEAAERALDKRLQQEYFDPANAPDSTDGRIFVPGSRR